MHTKSAIKDGLELYFAMNRLKTIIRQGAVQWKVDRPRLESDAEHIALAETLAIIMANQLGMTKELDMAYLLQMLNFHEIGELDVGDLTLYDKVDKDEKHKRELECAKRLLKKLKNSEYFVAMIDDFNNRRSKEAKFAHAIDKLENCLEFKIYEDLGQTNLKKGSKEMLNFPPVKKILEENKDCTFGELWWRYHLPSFAWLGFEEGDYKNLLKKIKLS